MFFLLLAENIFFSGLTIKSFLCLDFNFSIRTMCYVLNICIKWMCWLSSQSYLAAPSLSMHVIFWCIIQRAHHNMNNINKANKKNTHFTFAFQQHPAVWFNVFSHCAFSWNTFRFLLPFDWKLLRKKNIPSLECFIYNNEHIQISQNFAAKIFFCRFC